jgi:hypothetical protein
LGKDADNKDMEIREDSFIADMYGVTLPLQGEKLKNPILSVSMSVCYKELKYEMEYWRNCSYARRLRLISREKQLLKQFYRDIELEENLNGYNIIVSD